MVVEEFVSSIKQSIQTGIEEFRVQVEELLNDDFLNFGLESEMATSSTVQRDKRHLVRDMDCREGVPMSLWWTCSTVLHTCFRERKPCFHTCFS
ncbi:hypothetical protein AVEN_174719-1 [Araneus ventricosus]|uniref:Uncharacterized protein n=1 Tax=Araneus ventricosus TaxID=182803 RepID=A0A4Y2BMF4_ARAVE|nr:hypothetical protein AVEN_174719-1 [Araneus ventricosus]